VFPAWEGEGSPTAWEGRVGNQKKNSGEKKQKKKRGIASLKKDLPPARRPHIYAGPSGEGGLPGKKQRGAKLSGKWGDSNRRSQEKVNQTPERNQRGDEKEKGGGESLIRAKTM